VYPGSYFPESYSALVFSKFLRGLRYGNDLFKLIDSHSYFRVYHLVLESILNRPHTQIKFAVLTDDPDTVLGFSITEKNILHWIGVDKLQRNQRAGIVDSLLPSEVKVLTHITKAGMNLWHNKFPRAIFNPFQEEIV
jgi:hypothetical protein